MKIKLKKMNEICNRRKLNCENSWTEFVIDEIKYNPKKE